MDTLAFLIGIAVIFVGLAVSIALHEVGHLVPAKLFKVHVGKYMIGFGPTLWSKKFGETEYGFKLLPFGGFISMSGMYPPSNTHDARPARAGGGFWATMVQDARDANDETVIDDARSFYRLPMLKRIIIMLGGPVMNLLLAIVLFTIVLTGFGVQQATTTVAAVSECVVAADQQRETCEPSDPVAPAAAAGIKPGDRIISIDGTAITQFTQVTDIVSVAPGQPLTFVVERDGAELSLTVTPLEAQRQAYDENGLPLTNPDGSPVLEARGFIGMTAASANVPQPITAGTEQTFANVAAVTGIIAQMPEKLYNVAASLVSGTERDPNGPLSLVGVGRLAGEVAVTDTPIATRVSAMLSLVASLNVALFVFNLVPLLPLDGGHIAVALWDGIRRGWAKIFRRPAPRPVDATKLVPLTFVVVVLLIGMGALLLIADIFNPIKLFG